jgi:hypothetical protein
VQSKAPNFAAALIGRGCGRPAGFQFYSKALKGKQNSAQTAPVRSVAEM